MPVVGQSLKPRLAWTVFPWNPPYSRRKAAVPSIGAAPISRSEGLTGVIVWPVITPGAWVVTGVAFQELGSQRGRMNSEYTFQKGAEGGGKAGHFKVIENCAMVIFPSCKAHP
jgi:hypothetical protein